MYCIKCGEKLIDGSVFCAVCGASQTAAQPKTTEKAAGRNTGTDKRDIYCYEPLWNCWYIKDLIGAGSYGKVYLAYREEYGQTYYAAVKHIAIPQDDVQLRDLYIEGLADDEASAQEYYKQVLENILKEVKTNYELKGQPNIVLYEDHLVLARQDALGYDVFIKMELLTSLSEIVKNKTLTEQEVGKLGVDICTALEVMSRKRILHCDIKPANIFANDEGVYKLGDFGIARHMEKTISSVSVKGTFAYMPPEIQKGDKVDNRADIYSLGLVMYRLLNANRAPFLPLPPARVNYEDNNLAAERRFRGEKLPEPQSAGAAMSSIILKACSYRKEDRWQDAAELKQALQKFLQSSCSEQKICMPENKAQNIKNENAASLRAENKNIEKPAAAFTDDTVMMETDTLTQTMGLFELPDRTGLPERKREYNNNQEPIKEQSKNAAQAESPEKPVVNKEADNEKTTAPNNAEIANNNTDGKNQKNDNFSSRKSRLRKAIILTWGVFVLIGGLLFAGYLNRIDFNIALSFAGVSILFLLILLWAIAAESRSQAEDSRTANKNSDESQKD